MTVAGFDDGQAPTGCASCPCPRRVALPYRQQPRRSWTGAPARSRAPTAPANHGLVRVSERSTSPTPMALRIAPSARPATPGTISRPSCAARRSSRCETAPFNKLRMCVFPKRYIYNADEPELHAFARSDDGSLDFDRFDPAFFEALEARISELQALGIEADLILFHPYDTWGYQDMTAEQDERYLRHLVRAWAPSATSGGRSLTSSTSWQAARALAALPGDLAEADPYGHLTSIHNAERMFDHDHPGITHVSIQSWDVKRTRGVARALRQARHQRRARVRGGRAAAVGQHQRAGAGAPLLGHAPQRRLCRPRRDVPGRSRHPVVVQGRPAAGRESAAHRLPPAPPGGGRRPAGAARALLGLDARIRRTGGRHLALLLRGAPAPPLDLWAAHGRQRLCRSTSSTHGR